MVTQSAVESKKVISVPLTMEQLAFSLLQFSKKDLEVLEELLDKKFQKTIFNRGEKAISQIRGKQVVSLEQLQKEFGQ